MNFFDDLNRIGLAFSEDGAQVTVTPECIPALFGRPADRDFEVTMPTTDLFRVRGLIRTQAGELHIPVTARFTTDEHGVQQGTRLIASAGLWQPFHVSVTYWWLSEDGTESQLRTQVLLGLHTGDVAHLAKVEALWQAGVRPRSRAPLYVAAAFSAREALGMQASDRTEDEVDGALAALVRLRGTYF